MASTRYSYPSAVTAKPQGIRPASSTTQACRKLTKLRYGVVIGMLVRRQIAKRHIFIRPGLDLARTVDPRRVAVQQDAQHHLRRVSGLAAAILGLIRAIDRAQVQRLHRSEEHTSELQS